MVTTSIVILSNPSPLSGVSLVLPTYNEEQRLPGTLQAIAEFRSRQPLYYECIVVDDHSVDQTHSVAAEFAANHSWFRLISLHGNRGKGNAVREGVLNSRCQLIFFLDADLAAALDNLSPAIKMLSDADMVIGCRTHEKSNILTPQPFSRRLFSRAGNLLIRKMAQLQYRDTQCGFKGFRYRTAKELFSVMRINEYMFDVELLVRGKAFGVRICEMPLQWQDMPGGKFSMLIELPGTLKDLLTIRRIYINKQYR